MKMFNSAVGVVMGLSLGSIASAATITSDAYTMGYGFRAPGQWDDAETITNNTPATQGDFTLDISVSGGPNSNTGAYFFNRIIQDGDGTAQGGTNTTFGATVTGTYNGVLPVGATNVRVTVNLSQVSIYAATFGASTQTLNLNETTLGHNDATTYSNNIVNDGTLVKFANSYHQVLFDPTDYEIPGTSAVRTFAVSGADAGEVNLDGFEILGTVSVSYDLVPEPVALSLMLPCFALLSRRTRI